jgi:hypothetical protein
MTAKGHPNKILSAEKANAVRESVSTGGGFNGFPYRPIPSPLHVFDTSKPTRRRITPITTKIIMPITTGSLKGLEPAGAGTGAGELFAGAGPPFPAAEELSSGACSLPPECNTNSFEALSAASMTETHRSPFGGVARAGEAPARMTPAPARCHPAASPSAGGAPAFRIKSAARKIFCALCSGTGSPDRFQFWT